MEVYEKENNSGKHPWLRTTEILHCFKRFQLMFNTWVIYLVHSILVFLKKKNTRQVFSNQYYLCKCATVRHQDGFWPHNNLWKTILEWRPQTIEEKAPQQWKQKQQWPILFPESLWEMPCHLLNISEDTKGCLHAELNFMSLLHERILVL